MCPPVIVDDESDENEEELDSPKPPASNLKAAATAAAASEDDDEDEDLQIPVRRGEIKSAKDLLGEEICSRARSVQARLKSHLSAKILISINGRERYLFDWSSDQPRCAPATSDQADCKIELSEDDLLRLCTGNLNPQIAMLSDKVKVSGKGDIAVYFFNLVAPRR